MKITKRVAAAAVPLLGLLAACSEEAGNARVSPAPGSTAASTPPQAAGRWEAIGTMPLTPASALLRVVASGPGEAWAMGYEEYTPEEDPGFPVLQRWDGTRWSEVPRGDLYMEPTDFAADGAGGIWMVGRSSKSALWDGRRWRARDVYGGSETHDLSGVAVREGRAILIGHEFTDAGWWARVRPFVADWDGRRFTYHTYGKGSGKFSAVATGDGHTWIAGARTLPGCAGITPLIRHRMAGAKGYDEVLVPDIPGGELNRIWQISPTDVWAVGTIWPDGGDAADVDSACAKDESVTDRASRYLNASPLVMRWDGSAWKRVDLPAWKGELRDVTAFGEDDVWVSGVQWDGEEGDAEARPKNSVFIHYDGKSWAREHGPVGDSAYTALARIPGTDRLWAVGSMGIRDDERAVILQRSKMPAASPAASTP
ncbi:hypothetical protein [Microtetraspora niveoalba]|uniref:hypothetical protein n=1 Tax=Microtetraspora niveoalba TaxID=46175 RepID=UPI000830984C|nr:hypothetical protein [Microtetraspora niveoalba]